MKKMLTGGVAGRGVNLEGNRPRQLADGERKELERK